MEAVGIVLNVGGEHVAEFESGFREHQLPVWEDFVARGVIIHASLAKLEISTQLVEGAVQYLMSVVFTDEEGHHLHDRDPRFQAWNDMAQVFQIAPPIVTGGEIVVGSGMDVEPGTSQEDIWGPWEEPESRQ